MKLQTLLFLLFLCVHGICQQGEISGRLIDARSREPVRNATVYINQTQVATQSDSGGYFKIRLTQSPAELLITHVSYQKRAVLVKHASEMYLIALQRSGAMQEVTVSAKYNWEKDWRRWGGLFTEFFIGPGFERKCVIVNPEVLRFRYDDKQMMLRAWARKPLKIENKTLGYIVHVDLDSFFYSTSTASFGYKHSNYFEPVRVRDAAHQRSIAANRLKAYGGSKMHFLRSVFNNTVEQEGFHVYRYAGRENLAKTRVRQTVLQAQMQQGNSGPADLSFNGKDSMRYYIGVLAQPAFWFIDSLPLDVAKRRAADTAGNILLQLGHDTLLLNYQPHDAVAARQIKRWSNLQEPAQYKAEVLNFLPKFEPDGRYSLMHLEGTNAITIQENGMAINKGTLLTQGFLSERRMA